MENDENNEDIYLHNFCIIYSILIKNYAKNKITCIIYSILIKNYAKAKNILGKFIKA